MLRHPSFWHSMSKMLMLRCYQAMNMIAVKVCTAVVLFQLYSLMSQCGVASLCNKHFKCESSEYDSFCFVFEQQQQLYTSKGQG